MAEILAYVFFGLVFFVLVFLPVFIVVLRCFIFLFLLIKKGVE
jgi:hypothetical protein